MNLKTSSCLFLLAFLAAIACGCARHPADEESGLGAEDPPGMRYLKERRSSDPCSYWERTRQLALAQWQSRALDPKPLLLYAHLGRPVQREQVRLGLLFFDEDKNVLGIGVKEQYLDGSGFRRELREEYPVFAHLVWREVLNSPNIHVSIRDAGQQKDPQAWAAYSEAEGIDEERVRKSQSYYRATLPPIWISAPDPNRVNVYVYVYDRDGHRSEEVEVENRLKRD